MANNTGRQGGGGNNQMNEHVEFTVKVSEEYESASNNAGRGFAIGFSDSPPLVKGLIASL
jgi:hypothetical protein